MRAAMRISAALNRSVAELFARPEDLTGASPQPVLLGVEDTPTTPVPVMIGRVGTQTVVVPLRNQLANAEAWTPADGTFSDDLVSFREPGADDLVVAGCDPLLGLLAAIASPLANARIIAVQASTGQAVEALARGSVHAITVHGTRTSLPKAPATVERFELARWQVGLASRASAGVLSIERVVERRLRTAQRAESATSQRALQHALIGAGASRGLPGPLVEGHLESARSVTLGIPVGLTMEPAALAFGLSFFSIERHITELWVDRRWIDNRTMRVMIDLLTERVFLRQASRIAGYDLHRTGTHAA